MTMAYRTMSEAFDVMNVMMRLSETFDPGGACDWDGEDGEWLRAHSEAIDAVARLVDALRVRVGQLEQDRDAARDERDAARRFAEDAARRYNELLATAAENTAVTCAYCGVVYPAGTPRHGDGVLAEHIRQCAAHPMRAVEAENARLRDVLDAIASPGTIEDFGNGWAVGLARRALAPKGDQ